jgi:hypothetical protein
MFTFLRRVWRWLTRADELEKFWQHEAEIDRRIRELDERVARGCRQTDGRIRSLTPERLK